MILYNEERNLKKNLVNNILFITYLHCFYKMRSN